MPRYTHEELKDALGSGLLSFPVTHFASDLAFDEQAYRAHIAWLGDYKPAGLFAAGGTGEFFSLTPAEVGQVVRAAVSEAPDNMPIIAPAGYGTALAVELARDAERARADAVLLLPPYLVGTDQRGLVAHVQAVCAATSLGVIIYHRANAAFTSQSVERLSQTCSNLIGFKDGVGDIELMTRLYANLGDRLRYIGGLPTAEVYALPYSELGVTTYSSAIFNFAPTFALDFFAAVRARDRSAIFDKLKDFVLPYLDIRNRRAGYSVSIVKAGMAAVGRSAGSVRPPLSDLDDHELTELINLTEKIKEHDDRHQ